MKKTLVAMAVLAASGAAMAQSSVTLFGVADAAVKYGRGNVANVTALGSGGNSTSRLGFRGVEDLGGGLTAGFWLEAGQAMDNGSFSATNTNNQAGGSSGGGGLTFNRRSTVSLMGNFGEVRLGRDFAATYRNVGDFDPTGDVGVGSTLMDSKVSLSSVTRAVRVSNSVNYFTPGNLGGFYGQLQYYMGENATDTVTAAGVTTAGKKDGTGAGARLGYAQGPLNVALSFGSTKYLVAPPVAANTPVIAAGNESTVNFGGTYDLGMAKLFALYNQDKVKATGGDLKGQGYLLGASAPMGQGELRASYSNYKQKLNLTTGDPSVGQLMVGYVYNLSKRTAVYSTVAFAKTKGQAAGAVGYGLNGSSTGTNGNSTGLDFGLRHSF